MGDRATASFFGALRDYGTAEEFMDLIRKHRNLGRKQVEPKCLNTSAQQRTEKTASQARLEENLKQALREVKMEGEGKLTMQSWEEFEEELKREGYFD